VTARRLIALVLMLAACAQPGEITMVPSAAGIGAAKEVFIGTTRALDPATGEFGPDRVPLDSYARYVVQVPPDREPGEIGWPPRNGRPDPSKDFVTLEQEIYAGAPGFRADLASALRRQPAGQREVIIFAHGFNTTFAEGLYRIAQLDHDLDLPGVVVHYSWPSRGKTLAYLADRDSAIFARDGYETLLDEVVSAGAQRIVIVGHSMGSLLTMEALRQVAIDGNRRVLDRIAGVILISPDIDVDLFHQQASRIGKLPQPFYVFTSQKDRALAISARLTGRRERLGNLEDPGEVADLDVTLIEVGEFAKGVGHFAPGDSPVLIGILGRLADVDAAFGADRSGNPDLITGTVLTFRNATQIVLSPVTAIAQEIAN
jgi:esterase/lipase superfamily enzyme